MTSGPSHSALGVEYKRIRYGFSESCKKYSHPGRVMGRGVCKRGAAQHLERFKAKARLLRHGFQGGAGSGGWLTPMRGCHKGTIPHLDSEVLHPFRNLC